MTLISSGKAAAGLRRILLSLAAVAAVVSLGAGAAQAQATRTWVSGVGDDANPCSRTAPCKTFAGAISKTATGGEINVLDPGGFGGVTITKAITIRSTFEAGVLVSGTNAIVVSAPATDNVILEGLDIEGLGTSPNGIRFLAGRSLTVVRCSINRFTTNAIDFQNSTNGSFMLVKDSVITNNNVGINVQNPAGVSNAAAVVNSTINGQTSVSLQTNGSLSGITYAYSLIA